MLPWALVLLLAIPSASESTLETELAGHVTRGEVSLALRTADRLVEVHERALGARSPALAEALDKISDQVAALDAAAAKAWVERQLLRSLALQERQGGREDPRLHATLARLSNLCFELGKWECAEAHDRRLLEIRRRTLTPTHTDLGESNLNVGLSLYWQARLREAQPFLTEAVRIFEMSDPPRPLYVAAAIGLLAEDLRAQNRYREAEEMFTRAIGMVERLPGPNDDLYSILVNYSGLLRDTNRYAESHYRIRQALENEERSPTPRRTRLISLWHNLAELLRLEGDPVGAERFFRRALDASREVHGPHHPYVGIYLNQLAVLFSEQKRFGEAESSYESALGIKTKALGSNHPEVAQTHYDLGRLLLTSSRPAEAKQAFLRALKIREAALGKSHPDVAVTLLALAEAETDASSGPAVRTLLDRALRILETSPAEARVRVRALSLRARRRYAANDRQGAMTDLSQALDILDRLRPESGGGEQTRSRFLADALEEFHRMMAWKLEQGDVAGAFAVAERGRARALLDQLATAGVDLRAGISAEIRRPLEQRESEQRALIAELSARLARIDASPGERRNAREIQARLREAQQEFERTYEETKNASALWRGRRGEELASLETLRREIIPAGGLMLYYVVGGERTTLFAILPTGPVEAYSLEVTPVAASSLGISSGPLTRERLAHLLDPSAASDDALRGLLDRLQSPRSGPLPVLERMLNALWQTLVPPAVAGRVSIASEVVVVPDGLLNRVPFEAMVIEPAAPGREVRYWIDGGPVVRYAASANTLLTLTSIGARRRPDPLGRILSVSDPIYAAERGSVSAGSATSAVPALERLPGTAREAAGLREALGSRVVSLEREAAREEAVVAEMSEARYLHLATHGIVDESGGGLFASLALTVPPAAPRPSDDGQLQLHEIYELHLDADLAILSSCETRSGSVVSGEGVFALSRAFLAAGTRRVIASLWPADDDATGEVMGTFFRTWAEMEKTGAPTDFARALFSARRSVRAQRRWRHPFYWAPFVLEGPG